MVHLINPYHTFHDGDDRLIMRTHQLVDDQFLRENEAIREWNKDQPPGGDQVPFRFPVAVLETMMTAGFDYEHSSNEIVVKWLRTNDLGNFVLSTRFG